MIQDIFPHKLDNHFKPGQVPEDADVVLVFSGENVLCRLCDEGIVFPSAGEFECGKCCPTPNDASGSEGTSTPRAADMSVPAGNAALTPSNVPERDKGTDRNPGSSVAGMNLPYLFDVDGERYFLGDGTVACSTARDGEDAFEYAGDSGEATGNGSATHLPEGYEFVPLRSLRKKNARQKHRIFAAITARHLNDWYRTVRFCGCCGQSLRPSETERAMVCPSCGQVFYPRINPAVIVGVTHGDALLLTRYAGRRLSSYALVAGFTEIGETLEETVAREVMEETGLTVTNIRYYKSQPWGFASDILAGYYCDVIGDPTIHRDENELKEAVWMPRADIPGQSDDFSLTNEMMCAFRDGMV